MKLGILLFTPLALTLTAAHLIPREAETEAMPPDPLGPREVEAKTEAMPPDPLKPREVETEADVMPPDPLKPREAETEADAMPPDPLKPREAEADAEASPELETRQIGQECYVSGRGSLDVSSY